MFPLPAKNSLSERELLDFCSAIPTLGYVRTINNPKNRFVETEVEWDPGAAPLATLRVHEEQAKSILSENNSPDLPFRYSINPYRGCQHGCAYCYARPSHQYWGFGAGTDFEREIIVKVNAVDVLRETFERGSYQPDLINFSGNTDCYQPLEGRYRLTRSLLAVCCEYRNPVTIITKSALVLRDLDILQELNQQTRLRVFLSIPFANDAMGRAVEPAAAPISRRLDALAQLSAAGIETGVAVAPLIPGLSDSAIAPVLRASKDAGARYAFGLLLRLPQEVAPVFLSRLRQAFPLAADKVEHALREMRGGQLHTPAFGERMRGHGPRFDALQAIFESEAKRLGLLTRNLEENSVSTTFRRPTSQLSLFEP